MSQIDALDEVTRQTQRNTRLMLIATLFMLVLLMLAIVVVQDLWFLALALICYIAVAAAFIANGLRLERKGQRIIRGDF